MRHDRLRSSGPNRSSSVHAAGETARSLGARSVRWPPHHRVHGNHCDIIFVHRLKVRGVDGHHLDGAPSLRRHKDNGRNSTVCRKGQTIDELFLSHYTIVRGRQQPIDPLQMERSMERDSLSSCPHRHFESDRRKKRGVESSLCGMRKPQLKHAGARGTEGGRGAAWTVANYFVWTRRSVPRRNTLAEAHHVPGDEAMP